MKNKKLLLSPILLILPILFTLLVPKSQPTFPTYATEYTVLLNEESTFTQSASPTSGSTDAMTGMGNPVTFAFNSVSALSGGFQTFDPGSYMLNEDAITGLSSIQFSLGTGSAPLTLSYGWDGVIYHVTNLTFTESTNYNFENSYPNYIKIENTSLSDDLLINSIQLNFQCSPSQNPFINNGVTYFRNGNQLTAASYSGTHTSIELLPSIHNVNLTAIAPSIFENNTTVTAIFLPSTVTSIGEDAFLGCTSAIIYTDALTSRVSWGSTWNPSNRPVKWETFSTSVRITGTLSTNDFVFDAFRASTTGNVFGLDKASADVFEVSSVGILGPSVHFKSNGSYAGSYFNQPSFTIEANTKYKVEFDYKLLSLVDTIYFQFTSPGNSVFAQFGLPGEVGQVTHFTHYFDLLNANDYVLQMFPGGGSGVTEFFLDNLKITKVDRNVTTAGALQVNDFLRETFDDNVTAINIDSAPTPSSYIAKTDDYISGRSFTMVSGGGFSGFYMTAPGKWSAGSYRISIEYRVISIGGNLWFKAYASTPAETSMGVIPDGNIHTFTFEFAHNDGTDVVLQIFPNAPTTVVFDNFVITKLS